MSLRKRQSEFCFQIGCLISHAYHLGYELTFGDAYRDPRVTWTYGSETSKHKKRLAVDFNLFRNGQYLSSTEDHRPLGDYWESIGGIWGGRFRNSDGNHYEWPTS